MKGKTKYIFPRVSCFYFSSISQLVLELDRNWHIEENAKFIYPQKYLFNCVCLGVCAWVYACASRNQQKSETVSGPLIIGGSGSVSSYVDAGKQTQALCDYSSKCSKLLSHLSRPWLYLLFYILWMKTDGIQKYNKGENRSLIFEYQMQLTWTKTPLQQNA